MKIAFKNNDQEATTHSLAKVMVVLLGVLPILDGEKAKAGELPSVREVITNIIRATSAPHDYSVAVSQRQIQPNASGAVASTTAPTPSPGSQQFQVKFHHETGEFKVGAVIQQNASGQSGPAAAKTTSQGNIQVGVNLTRFLKNIATWPQLEETEQNVNGQSVIEITADSKKALAAHLWVDPTNWYISRLVLNINGKQFVDSSFSYKKVEGTFLPSRIEMNHAFDGTQIIQEFGDYLPPNDTN